MRILVTGSRDWPYPEIVERAILDLNNWYPIDWDEVIIVHGAARGADTQAKKFAITSGIGEEPHPANWKKHGKAAGPIRNQEMIETDPDIVLAFLQPWSIGTRDCINRAVAAGMPVVIYREVGPHRNPDGDIEHHIMITGKNGAKFSPDVIKINV